MAGRSYVRLSFVQLEFFQVSPQYETMPEPAPEPANPLNAAPYLSRVFTPNAATTISYSILSSVDMSWNVIFVDFRIDARCVGESLVRQTRNHSFSCRFTRCLGFMVSCSKQSARMNSFALTRSMSGVLPQHFTLIILRNHVIRERLNHPVISGFPALQTQLFWKWGCQANCGRCMLGAIDRFSSLVNDLRELCPFSAKNIHWRCSTGSCFSTLWVAGSRLEEQRNFAGNIVKSFTWNFICSQASSMLAARYPRQHMFQAQRRNPLHFPLIKDFLQKV